MASFIERVRCPTCGAGAIGTLLSRDLAHPSVWRFLARRYNGQRGQSSQSSKLDRRELAGRRHEIARCGLCTLVFQRFVLSDASLARLYDDWPETDEREPIELPLLAGGVPNRVLELGAGDGRFCAAAGAIGCHVIAVDISSRRLEALRASGFVAHANVDDVARDPIDWVRCHGILEHLPRPFETLQALAERLAPGGRIDISVPDARRATAELTRTCWTADDDALRPLEHVNGFSPSSLNVLAKRLDLRVDLEDRTRRLPWQRPATTIRLTLSSTLAQPRVVQEPLPLAAGAAR